MKKLLITVTLTALMSCVSPVEEPAAMARIEEDKTADTIMFQRIRGTESIHIYDTFWQPVMHIDNLFDTTTEDHHDRAEACTTYALLDYGVYNVVHRYEFFRRKWEEDTVSHYEHSRRSELVLDTLSESIKNWYEMYPR